MALGITDGWIQVGDVGPSVVAELESGLVSEWIYVSESLNAV